MAQSLQVSDRATRGASPAQVLAALAVLAVVGTVIAIALGRVGT